MRVSAIVEDEGFINWMDLAMGEFISMAQTMIDVAHLIELHSRKYVPIDTGRLEHSYHFVVEEKTSEFVEVDVGYDAIDPDSGFHYAQYQHDEFLHHKDRHNKFEEYNAYGWTTLCRAKYLKRGIHDAKEQAFVMIETDYLSLFKGV